MEAWESHLESRENPAFDGRWGETPWGFYEYDQKVPSSLPIRTGMCVPVRSFDPHNPQVMLTLNLGRGGYEIPGGHLDSLEDGRMESSAQAASREVAEETGLEVEPNWLVPYGYIEAQNKPGGKYPPRNYMQFFGVHAPGIPGEITDPEVDGAGVFTLDALGRMTERGAMRTTELQLVCAGIRAVFKHSGLPYAHISMP